MPAYRLPPLRRPVVVLRALVAAVVLAMLLGPVPVAGAAPHSGDAGPHLTLPTDVAFVIGQPESGYLIAADGDPVPAIGVDGLPRGLRLIAHGDGSATIAGTPTGPAGTITVEVRAQSAAGSTSESLTVTIQQAPAFVDRDPPVFTVGDFTAGEFASVVVRTVGYPAPGIALDGDLPIGLTFVDNGDGTATIAGTPVDGPGSSPVTLTAVNVVSDIALTTTIRVVARPDAAVGPGSTGQSSSGPWREPYPAR